MKQLETLSIKDFDEKLIPHLDEWCQIPATLQRKCGLKGFETGLKPQRRPRVTVVHHDAKKRTITVIGRNERIIPIPHSINFENLLAFYGVDGREFPFLVHGVKSKKSPSYNAYYTQLKKAFKKIGHEPMGIEEGSKGNVPNSECLRTYFILDWLYFGTTLEELEEIRQLADLKTLKELQPYINHLALGDNKVKHYFDRF